MKVIKILLVLVVLVVVGGVILFVTNVNGLVRTAVEQGSTKSLNLPTTLGSANVGLLSGDVSLNQLTISNPPGYGNDPLFTLGNVRVDTSYGKLRGKPVAIDAIEINAPRIVIEQKNGKFNIREVADRLGGSSTGEPAPSEPTASGEAIKLIIESLKVEGAQVVFKPNMPGLKDEYVVGVPPIELKQIGNADGNRNGEELGRVVSQLLATVSAKALESDQLPPELRQLVSLDLDNLASAIGGGAQKMIDQAVGEARAKIDEKIGEVRGKVDEAAQNAKDKLRDGLGGLLGEKKDDATKPASNP